MGYISGNIATDPTPGVTMTDLLITEMLAEGWVLEEDYALTATNHWVTYKSPAANNAQGVDWFVTFERDETPGSDDDLRMIAVSEDYIDSTTTGGNPQVSDFCVSGTEDISDQGVDPDGTWGGLDMDLDEPEVMTAINAGSLSTLNQQYMAYITGDYILVSAEGRALGFAGFYEPLVPGLANHVPLMANYSIGSIGTNTGIAYGGTSRMLHSNGSAFNEWTTTTYPLWQGDTMTPELGDVNGLYGGDPVLFAQRILASVGWYGDASPAGFLPDVVLWLPQSAAPTRGDTITIEGSQYAALASPGEYWLATGL